MNIEIELNQLTQKARNNKNLREKLLNTQNEKEPIKAFCNICEEEGYRNITPYGMLTIGEEFCATMLRSVNGGGVNSPDEWDDYYELLMSELEHMK